MKNGQRLLGLILGLMIGISLLTVSVLAAMDAVGVQETAAPVLYASGDTTNATPTPDPTPTATASTGTTRPTPTPEATVTPIPDNKTGVCGDGLVWEITGSGMLVISGEGEMYDYADGEAPWYEHVLQIRSVELKEGVTGVGSNAFCNFVSLEDVTIPYSIKKIGVNAFAYCNGLMNVYFAGSERHWNSLNILEGNDCLTALVPIYLYADVNGDGMVDARDVIRLMLCVLGAAEPCGPAAGDYNNDNIVDILDVIRVLRWMAGDAVLE